MKWSYRILRTLAVSLIVLIFVVPAILYVGLALPSVQDMIRRRAERELSGLLTVPVTIDRVMISPFNRVMLRKVSVADGRGDTALAVDRLGVGMSLWDYFYRDRIVLDYAEIVGLDARIYRDSAGAPLNIAPIIEALAPKDKSKPPTRFDLRINTVVIRRSAVAYDVLSAPPKETGFDTNHIAVTDLRADITVPQLKNDDFIVDLRRMAFAERSGANVTSLSGKFHISDRMLAVDNFDLQMPASNLRLNNQSIPINGFNDIPNALRTNDFDVALLPGSHISTTDIAPFLPQLEGLDINFSTDIHLAGNARQVDIKTLRLHSSTGALIEAEGMLSNLDDREQMTLDLPHVNLRFNSPRALLAALRFTSLSPTATTIINNLGDVDLTASARADMLGGDLKAKLTSATGSADIDASMSRKAATDASPIRIDGNVALSDFSGALLMGGLNNQLTHLTDLDATAEFNLTLNRGNLADGNLNLDIESVTFNGRTVNDLTAAVEKHGGSYSANIFVDDNDIYGNATATAEIMGKNKSLEFTGDFRDVNLSLLGLLPPGKEGVMSLTADAVLTGTSIDDVEGTVTIDRIDVARPDRDEFTLTDVVARSIRGAEQDSIVVQSEIADVNIAGRYHFASLVPVGRAIIARTLPALAGDSKSIEGLGAGDAAFWRKATNSNELSYHIILKTLKPLEAFARMPVSVINPIDITGDFSTSHRSLSLRVDAPYIVQGNRLIENTSLIAGVTAADSLVDINSGHIYLTSTIPTKKGPMTIISTTSARDDRLDTRFEWRIDRDHDFSGDLSLSALFSRGEAEGGSTAPLHTLVNVNPSRLVFNDTVWTVDPSSILVEGKTIEVNDFKVWRDKQYLAIDGHVSELDTDTLRLTLEDINLDYVFETLDIANVTFGGNATGVVYGTRLLTKEPVAMVPALNVRGLSYNHSLMGDAVISSEWINSTGAITLKANVDQANGRHSIIDGAIYPLADSLDISFDCDRIGIGFLKPYMAAFATDVKGYASGHARLYGTFKLIDLEGDVYGEDVSITLGFTNVAYTTTDSVHFRPGRIQLSDMVIADQYGNKARLNGWVTHECFKNPSFDFRISDAHGLLVYDMKENTDFQWYGRVFGDGGAHVEGHPGSVSINVNMATAANSAFTYVLSDVLSAQDYNFITFRDRDQARKDSIAALNAPPDFVREFRQRMAQNNQTSDPSKYALHFNIGITPQATITMVMDPVGGDRIRCHGSGVLDMYYDSANEDLRMNGTYTLDDGRYNFTLQDIIIKDFTIEPGSSIAFNGDPYSAQLDLTAKFQVKANLTDLDESFSDDKELNRTNVPVDALLKVTGDMRQPEISFDLAFPTLTEETRRKVRSIINTEEMLNRQIIYLLALNRFYTPDYMNATRGNELVSVASSTISSQLSNIFGQLSDKWSLAPNFRSDRGDFSDMEFDMAISSNLLNNRLLLNGNLGYRDKSLNNNSFIGDFDIEYLLNRNGSLRLKAYNRYNDQNYYLKSALTTQGVGIVFKRDFDNILSFLNPFRRRKSTSVTALPTDSTHTPADSITNR